MSSSREITGCSFTSHVLVSVSTFGVVVSRAVSCGVIHQSHTREEVAYDLDVVVGVFLCVGIAVGLREAHCLVAGRQGWLLLTVTLLKVSHYRVRVA